MSKGLVIDLVNLQIGIRFICTLKKVLPIRWIQSHGVAGQSTLEEIYLSVSYHDLCSNVRLGFEFQHVLSTLQSMQRF